MSGESSGSAGEPKSNVDRRAQVPEGTLSAKVRLRLACDAVSSHSRRRRRRRGYFCGGGAHRATRGFYNVVVVVVDGQR